MVKQKNNCLLARLCSLIGVLLLICCMILPASAASGSGSEWYSVLPIQGVRFIQSSSAVVDLPWSPDLFMSGSQDLTAGDGTVGYGVTSISSDFDNRYVTYDVAFYDNLASFNSIVLYSDSCFINVSDLRNKAFLISCGYDGSDGCRVDISFTANRIHTVGSDYSVEHKTFSEGFHAGPDTNIMGLISSMLTDGNFVPSDVVYLTNLQITLALFENDDQWIQFATDVRRTRPTAVDWFDQYRLPIENVIVYDSADPSDVSFVDWLVVAVGGFLDFELWPGMSLNEIMWVILVIGILFWFLKLTL